MTPVNPHSIAVIYRYNILKFGVDILMKSFTKIDDDWCKELKCTKHPSDKKDYLMIRTILMKNCSRANFIKLHQTRLFSFLFFSILIFSILIKKWIFFSNPQMRQKFSIKILEHLRLPLFSLYAKKKRHKEYCLFIV